MSSTMGGGIVGGGAPPSGAIGTAGVMISG